MNWILQEKVLTADNLAEFVGRITDLVKEGVILPGWGVKVALGGDFLLPSDGDEGWWHLQHLAMKTAAALLPPGCGVISRFSGDCAVVVFRLSAGRAPARLAS